MHIAGDDVWDYAGVEDTLDRIDELLSSSTKGGLATSQPTLVIDEGDDVDGGNEPIRTGADYAIFARNAKYLEISGTALDSVGKQIKDLRQYVLDTASVILQDPDKATGGTVSAAAMKMRYAPMVARCDMLRAQYGEVLTEILNDMLRTSQQLQSGPTETEDGVEQWSQVVLPPRVKYEDSPEDENGREKEPVVVERSPGAGREVELKWPPYFPATWEDKKKAIESARLACGNRPVLSQRTAVESIATLFGVTDVGQELGEIDQDAERGLEMTMRTMQGTEGGPPGATGGPPRAAGAPKPEKPPTAAQRNAGGPKGVKNE